MALRQIAMAERWAVRDEEVGVVRDEVPPVEERPAPLPVERPAAVRRLPRSAPDTQPQHLATAVLKECKVGYSLRLSCCEPIFVEWLGMSLIDVTSK